MYPRLSLGFPLERMFKPNVGVSEMLGPIPSRDTHAGQEAAGVAKIMKADLGQASLSEDRLEVADQVAGAVRSSARGDEQMDRCSCG
jgi:hypothetical protein